MGKQKQVIDLKHFISELRKTHVAQGGKESAHLCTQISLVAFEKETLRLKEEAK